jgi:4-amino-4-deoxy-L-arabinose transferase-like glycosyltransferase
MPPIRARWAFLHCIALVALILLAAAALRFGALKYSYTHPDEVIAVEVAESMLARGTLDTNWRWADLPAPFKVPQYNFSGYLLGAAAVLQLREWWPLERKSTPLRWLRGWSALLGIATVGLTFLVGRRFFGTATAICAALLVAVFPLLVQDSLYARPETFLTCLTLVFVWLVVTVRAPLRSPAFLAAVLAGFLIATKVSLLLLLPLLLLAIEPPVDRTPAGPAGARARAWLAHMRQHGLPLVPAVLAGFVLGAPFALGNFGDYVDGILALRLQYGTGHWPHGVVEGGFLDRLDHAGRYFHSTAGWLLFLGFIGAAAAAWQRQHRQLVVFLIAFATALQFAAYPTFFERNLSHVVPIFMIFSAYGLVAVSRTLLRSPRAAHALLAVLLLVVTVPALRTTLALRLDELPGHQARRQQATRSALEGRFGVRSTQVGWLQQEGDIWKALAYRCDGPMLLEMPSTDDAHSKRQLAVLEERDGFALVARLPSLFAHVPPSTLHTYFTATTVFLYRRPGVEVCKTLGGGLVTADAVGEGLPLISLHTDPSWTRRGAARPDLDHDGPADYYASWSGTDAATGRLGLVVSTTGAQFLVLPYRTGPIGRQQTIVVTDATTGKVILKSHPVPSEVWQYPVLRLPADTRVVSIEAVDAGSAWGEWLALGMPRTLKTD